MSADGRLSNCEWVENPNRGFTGYASGEVGVTYLPMLTLHMTVGMALSKSYVAGHRVPPHQWYNVYTGDSWQTQELDLAAKALYQQPYGDHWSNKHAYNIQTELVGVPVVNVVTYTDEECYKIARDVVVPQILWLRAHGMDINLDTVHQVNDSSGSASEYWHGRCSEDEMARFNGITQHIRWPYNDHWDCSIEKLWLIAQYAKQILGQATTPPKKRKPRMLEGKLRTNPDGSVVEMGDQIIGTAVIYDLIGRSGGKIIHHPAKAGGSSYVKAMFKGQIFAEGWSKWNMAVEWTIPNNIPDADKHTNSPGLVSVIVHHKQPYHVIYEGP